MPDKDNTLYFLIVSLNTGLYEKLINTTHGWGVWGGGSGKSLIDISDVATSQPD